MKICSHCGQARPESEFYRDKTRKDGLDCYCMLCRKANNMKYTDAGQERRAERMRTNPEYRKKVLEYHKEYNARKNERINKRSSQKFG